MERLDRYLVGIVLAHFAAVLVHGGAHLSLGLVPGLPDAVFIGTVFFAGPLVALGVLPRNRPFASGFVAVLMGAAFAYGFDSHFIAPGPDRIAFDLASSVWTQIFVVSAAVIGMLEVAALGLAAALFAAAVRSPSAPAGPRA